MIFHCFHPTSSVECSESRTTHLFSYHCLMRSNRQNWSWIYSLHPFSVSFLPWETWRIPTVCSAISRATLLRQRLTQHVVPINLRRNIEYKMYETNVEFNEFVLFLSFKQTKIYWYIFCTLYIITCTLTLDGWLEIILLPIALFSPAIWFAIHIGLALSEICINPT